MILSLGPYFLVQQGNLRGCTTNNKIIMINMINIIVVVVVVIVVFVVVITAHSIISAWHDQKIYTLWYFNIAIENGPVETVSLWVFPLKMLDLSSSQNVNVYQAG